MQLKRTPHCTRLQPVERHLRHDHVLRHLSHLTITHVLIHQMGLRIAAWPVPLGWMSRVRLKMKDNENDADPSASLG